MARLLFVTSRLPYPPREGHQLRSWHLLRAAASRHRVHLLSLQRPQDPRVPDPVLLATVASVHCVELKPVSDPRTALPMLARWLGDGRPLLSARYISGDLQRQFQQLLSQVDLVHLDILAVAGLMAQVPVPIPVVLNEHNVEHLLLSAHSQIETRAWKRALLRLQARELAAFEAAACKRAAAVLACSPIDAERLTQMAPRTPVTVIPNGVDLDQYQPRATPAPDSDALVFVGQMSWFPNRDGIEWFLAEVLPLIRERRPAKLTVIGQSSGMLAPTGLEAAVEFTGFVEDLRPRALDAAVYVVPLRAGSGTRLKILEAMAMGKAIVSTRIGAEGIGLVDGEDALLADTPQDFADAVCRLLKDPALRERLGRAARRAAERDYGWDAIGQRLLAVYEQVIGRVVGHVAPAKKAG